MISLNPTADAVVGVSSSSLKPLVGLLDDFAKTQAVFPFLRLPRL
jgi:hypothetical protein